MTGYTGTRPSKSFKSTTSARHRAQCEMTVVLLTLKSCRSVELCKPGLQVQCVEVTDQRRNRVTGYAALAKPVIDCYGKFHIYSE